MTPPSFKVIQLVVTLVVVGAIIIFALGALVSYIDTQEARCGEQFGSEWEFRSGDRSPDICVNEDGEVKYL